MFHHIIFNLPVCLPEYHLLIEVIVMNKGGQQVTLKVHRALCSFRNASITKEALHSIQRKA